MIVGFVLHMDITGFALGMIKFILSSVIFVCFQFSYQYVVENIMFN